MITMERLLAILDDWKLYMKSSSNRLGYPTQSLGMSSGGESTSDEFEHMVNAMDKSNVRTLSAIIDSLEYGQREALYAKYLGGNKPLAYEWQLDMAMDNLLTMASRRINA